MGCVPASSTWLKSRKSLIYETFLLSLSNMGILFLYKIESHSTLNYATHVNQDVNRKMYECCG